MATPLPALRIKYGTAIGTELFFTFPDLQDNEETFLDADIAAGVSTLSADGANFSANDYVVIGQPGNERTEIIQVSSATNTALNFIGSTAFAHNRGDIIRFIPYNQIAAEYATASGGTFVTITAVTMRADSTETYMQRTADTSAYVYRFRFYNSSTTLYSAYSNIASATGYATNSLWSIKDRAMRQLGEVRGDLITEQFLNDSVFEGRRQADMNPAIFRWSFREKFGAVLGQILAGQWSIAVPTDLRDPNTYKNILSLRIGDQNRPVIYQDRRRFNQNYLNVVHTTTNGSVLSGATSIILTSSHDLPATGTLTVANNVTQAVLTTVTYTANNKATNTISGCTYNTARAISTLTDVWLRQNNGLPSAYTVDAGIIYFDVPLKTDYDGQDVKTDYYGTIPAMAKDSDLFDEPFYDLYVYWVKWKVKSLKANGKLDRNSDPDYQDWITGLADLIGQEVGGQKIQFVPDIEGYLSGSGNG